MADIETANAELVEELAREFEKRDVASAMSWTDEQFEIWWTKDSRSVADRRKQRARARFAVKFMRERM